MNVVLANKETVLVTADDVKLIESLSNGIKREEAAFLLKIKIPALDMRLRRLRLKLKLKSNYQLVSHFIREGWIQ